MARRIVEPGKTDLGWDKEELQARPKGDKQKVKMAQRL